MPLRCLALSASIVVIVGCSRPAAKAPEQAPESAKEQPLFRVDPSIAGTVRGRVEFRGARPAVKVITMDADAECARIHKGRGRPDEPLVVNRRGALANVFVYLKTGLEGKRFEVPASPAIIDQKGCWFHPRVLGIRAGQTLQVTNSDPVTHNIHPTPVANNEWNQSQSPDDPPITRRFARPEIMVPVKCNIHRWMHAYIGVVDHPYFAVTGADGSFAISNVPPGTYTISAWQETLGSQDQPLELAASSEKNVVFAFKGE